MADKPILVFDVNETLLDIETLSPLFARLFGRADMMREWFAQLILYSQTLTLSGIYTPFGEIGIGALHMTARIHGVSIDDDDIAEMKALMGALPAHPDSEPGLVQLREAGFRMVTLTNSPSNPAGTPLDKAGLAHFFERQFHVEAVSRYKPAPETYHHVARELGVQPTDLCLVAAHLWDTIGAQAVGAKGAFITRPYNAMLPADAVPVPDYQADTLTGLADRLIAAAAA